MSKQTLIPNFVAFYFFRFDIRHIGFHQLVLVVGHGLREGHATLYLRPKCIGKRCERSNRHRIFVRVQAQRIHRGTAQNDNRAHIQLDILIGDRWVAEAGLVRGTDVVVIIGGKYRRSTWCEAAGKVLILVVTPGNCEFEAILE